MAVAYKDFMRTVEETAGIPRDRAEQAVRATLQTLGERLSLGEAEDIAQQLPEEIRQPLLDGSHPQGFDLEEFLHRVARRGGVEDDKAVAHARAVFAALGRAVDETEIDDMAAQLPDDFSVLLSATRPPRPRPHPERVPTLEEFLDAVAQRMGGDRDRARRATESVLETLAERISGGEADDLAAFLPEELHRPIEVGKGLSRGMARPLSLDDFLQRIANREGVEVQAAREDARAVFGVLREYLSEKELADLFAEVPDTYSVIIGAP